MAWHCQHCLDVGDVLAWGSQRKDNIIKVAEDKLTVFRWTGSRPWRVETSTACSVGHDGNEFGLVSVPFTDFSFRVTTVSL